MLKIVHSSAKICYLIFKDAKCSVSIEEKSNYVTRIKRIPWPKTCRPRSGGVYTPHATDFNFYILFRREHFVSMNLRNNFRMNQGGGNGMKKNRTTSSSNP